MPNPRYADLGQPTDESRKPAPPQARSTGKKAPVPMKLTGWPGLPGKTQPSRGIKGAKFQLNAKGL